MRDVKGAEIVFLLGLAGWIALRHPESRGRLLRAFGAGVGHALVDIGWLLVAWAATAPLAWLLIVQAKLNVTGVLFLCLGVGYLAVGVLRPRWYLSSWRTRRWREAFGDDGMVTIYFVVCGGLILLGAAVAVLARGHS